ncbi:YdeI/OmpD-associated family protein [Luteimonas sp. A482]
MPLVALTVQGRMQAAGLAAFEARRPEKTGIYAFEREQAAELAADEVRAFKKNRDAWTYFEATPPGYRKVITHWVTSAKRGETRARRLEQLIQACAEQRRIV